MTMVRSHFERLLVAAALWLPLWAAPPIEGNLPKPVVTAMEHIAPNSLKGHLSFLSSDLLEGRNTPSRGLDIAAEYIAAQFRRAGLEPLPGTDTYFQIANWKLRTLPLDEVQMTFEHEGKRLSLNGAHFSIQRLQARKAENAIVYKASTEDALKLKDLPDDKLRGMVVLLTAPTPAGLRGMSEQQRTQSMRQVTDFNTQMGRLKPDAVLAVRAGEQGTGVAGQLIDPQSSRGGGFRHPLPVAVYSNALRSALDALPSGETAAKVSLRIPGPVEQPVQLRNVIGVLPGSDPQLKNTYVLVTAHYDHIGVTLPENGDGIYNGANDDGSGTVSVIEIASALAAQKERPKRTIVFMTVFGEEKGLLGSLYYSRNPVFPLDKTIVDINLEHMGRTDSSEGPQLGRLSITGYDYSDVPKVFTAAGQLTGVEFYKHETNSDAFFNRSDNMAFAEAGVPAHTFCAAFLFPDYHGLGDHWNKIDYENLAKLDRAVTAAVWMMADRHEVPHWDAQNPKAEKYRKARQGNKAVHGTRIE